MSSIPLALSAQPPRPRRKLLTHTAECERREFVSSLIVHHVRHATHRTFRREGREGREGGSLSQGSKSHICTFVPLTFSVPPKQHLDIVNEFASLVR